MRFPQLPTDRCMFEQAAASSHSIFEPATALSNRPLHLRIGHCIFGPAAASSNRPLHLRIGHCIFEPAAASTMLHLLRARATLPASLKHEIFQP